MQIDLKRKIVECACQSAGNKVQQQTDGHHVRAHWGLFKAELDFEGAGGSMRGRAIARPFVEKHKHVDGARLCAGREPAAAVRRAAAVLRGVTTAGAAAGLAGAARWRAVGLRGDAHRRGQGGEDKQAARAPAYHLLVLTNACHQSTVVEVGQSLTATA